MNRRDAAYVGNLQDLSDDELLEHYGVKGMKWGHRRKSGRASIRQRRQSVSERELLKVMNADQKYGHDYRKAKNKGLQDENRLHNKMSKSNLSRAERALNRKSTNTNDASMSKSERKAQNKKIMRDLKSRDNEAQREYATKRTAIRRRTKDKQSNIEDRWKSNLSKIADESKKSKSEIWADSTTAEKGRYIAEEAAIITAVSAAYVGLVYALTS